MTAAGVVAQGSTASAYVSDYYYLDYYDGYAVDDGMSFVNGFMVGLATVLALYDLCNLFRGWWNLAVEFTEIVELTFPRIEGEDVFRERNVTVHIPINPMLEILDEENTSQIVLWVPSYDMPANRYTRASSSHEVVNVDDWFSEWLLLSALTATNYIVYWHCVTRPVAPPYSGIMGSLRGYNRV